MTKTWYLSNKVLGIEDAVKTARKLGFGVQIEPIEMGWTKFTVFSGKMDKENYYENLWLVTQNFVDMGMCGK